MRARAHTRTHVCTSPMSLVSKLSNQTGHHTHTHTRTHARARARAHARTHAHAHTHTHTHTHTLNKEMPPEFKKNMTCKYWHNYITVVFCFVLFVCLFLSARFVSISCSGYGIQFSQNVPETATTVGGYHSLLVISNRHIEFLSVFNYSKLQPEHGVWRGACGHCVVQQVVPDLSKWWPAGWNWRRQPCVAILVAWQSLDLDQLSAANVLFSFFVLLRPGSACWPLLGCLSKAWTYIYTGPWPSKGAMKKYEKKN